METRQPFHCPRCGQKADGRHCKSPACDLYTCSKHDNVVVVFGYGNNLFIKSKSEKNIA